MQNTHQKKERWPQWLWRFLSLLDDRERMHKEIGRLLADLSAQKEAVLRLERELKEANELNKRLWEDWHKMRREWEKSRGAEEALSACEALKTLKRFLS